jgi:hypothetical protein
MKYVELNLTKIISHPVIIGYNALFESIKCKLVTKDKAEIYAYAYSNSLAVIVKTILNTK